jgi:hypothetical protein
MPNWVFNTLTIQGPKDQVDSIKDKLNTPFTREIENWNMDTMSMEFNTYTYDNPVFAFWNISRPTDLETYKLQSDPNEDKTVLFSGNNWYDWNVRNWGTKWDVAVSNDEQYPDTQIYEYKSEGDDHWVVYGFNTAWSPPVPAIVKLSELVPNCVITLSYEEEQGWGGETEFVNGKITAESSYDWKCRECDYEADETPYCENCEYDMCPECSYGEPDIDLWEKCPTHNVVLALSEKVES